MAESRNYEDELNRCMPAASHGKLGTTLVELIAGFNKLLADLTAVRARLSNYLLSSAGLVIKTSSSAVVKAGSAFIAVAGGVPVSKAANTDMSAIAGTLATAKAALWAFYIDSEGTITTSAKTADADDAEGAIALLPAIPENKAMIGYIVVENATGSNFVGGTTALDASNVTVTYYNSYGAATLDADMTAVELGALGTR